jgi:hypothetical protein
LLELICACTNLYLEAKILGHIANEISHIAIIIDNDEKWFSHSHNPSSMRIIAMTQQESW